MTLDQFIAKKLTLNRRDARFCLINGAVSIDGETTSCAEIEVSKFSTVNCDGRVLQRGIKRLYFMMHKPVGVLSATKDATHPTVLDAIDCEGKETLHLAGRLDRSSSGLVLITNDGHWSESLTDPAHKVEKHYLVETDRPIPASAVARFAEGFEFQPEGIITRPATLEILAPCRASVTLCEGRYHQIKRMFHRLDGIRLVSLHRDRIGQIQLPPDLLPGQYRALSEAEITSHLST